MADYIEVTAAVVKRDQTFLLAKRPMNKAFPGKWEFPGGKLESGERPDECMAREIKEEFGVEPVGIAPFCSWEFDYKRPDGKLFRFYSFFCSLPEAVFRLTAHDEIRWVSLEEMASMDLLEADKALLEELQVYEKKAAG